MSVVLYLISVIELLVIIYLYTWGSHRTTSSNCAELKKKYVRLVKEYNKLVAGSPLIKQVSALSSRASSMEHEIERQQQEIINLRRENTHLHEQLEECRKELEKFTHIPYKVYEVLSTIRLFMTIHELREHDIELKLAEFLQRKFPFYNIRRQVYLDKARRLRIDIVIDDIGIELKRMRDVRSFREAVGQAFEYKKYLEYVILVFIIDNDNKRLLERIRESVDELRYSKILIVLVNSAM